MNRPEIMIRHASDDFVALRVANAVESVGASVFSITDSGGAPHERIPGRFVLWIRYRDDNQMREVDAAILSMGLQK